MHVKSTRGMGAIFSKRNSGTNTKIFDRTQFTTQEVGEMENVVNLPCTYKQKCA